jgi:hypothetical protein
MDTIECHLAEAILIVDVMSFLQFLTEAVILTWLSSDGSLLREQQYYLQLSKN